MERDMDKESIPSTESDSSTARMIDEKNEKRRSFFSIDLLAVPSKAAFFLSGCIFGSHLPYINIFLVSIGLSTTQAGLISGIRFITSFIFHPMLGAFVDHTGRRILAVVALMLGVSISSTSIPVSAYLVSYNKTDSFTNKTEALVNTATSDNGLFFAMLLLISIASMFIIPHAGYIDTIVINLTKIQKRSFGRQKMFFSAGFAFCSFLSGLCVDYFYYEGFSKYTVTFIINATAALMILPVACCVISQVDWNEVEKPDDDSNEFISDRESNVTGRSKLRLVLDAFRGMDMIVFTVNVLVTSIAHSTYIDFTFLLTKDIIKSKAMVSLLVSVSSSSSILGFLVSAKVIKVLKNTTVVYVLSAFAYCLRFSVMSSVETYWIILIVQPLHGLCYAVTWTALLSDIQNNTAREVNATIHSIEQAIFLSLGPFLTNVIGGKIFQMFGGQLFFRGTGIICGIWGLTMILYEVKKGTCLRTKCHKEGELDSDESKLTIKM